MLTEGRYHNKNRNNNINFVNLKETRKGGRKKQRIKRSHICAHI